MPLSMKMHIHAFLMIMQFLYFLQHLKLGSAQNLSQNQQKCNNSHFILLVSRAHLPFLSVRFEGQILSFWLGVDFLTCDPYFAEK